MNEMIVSIEFKRTRLFDVSLLWNELILIRLSGHSVVVQRFSIITSQKLLSVTASPENFRVSPITAIGSIAIEM